jgi:hypothetical protein
MARPSTGLRASCRCLVGLIGNIQSIIPLHCEGAWDALIQGEGDDQMIVDEYVVDE